MPAVPPIPTLKTKVGDRFGRLTVTNVFDREPRQWRRVLAVCDCGTEQVFTSVHLRQGRNRRWLWSVDNEHQVAEPYASTWRFGGKEYLSRLSSGRCETRLPIRVDMEEFMRLTQCVCAYCGAPPSTVS